MKILVDMDGVLADFDDGFLKTWQNLHADKPFIPIDQRTTFYVVDQYPEELKDLIRQTIAAPNFFGSLPPLPGSVEALTGMRAMGHDVYICTSAISAFRSCVVEKFEWVEAHLGTDWVKSLIFAKDRTMLRGDVLIDDRPAYEGGFVPSWEHVIFDRPYNREVVGKRRLTWDDWKAVLFGGNE